MNDLVKKEVDFSGAKLLAIKRNNKIYTGVSLVCKGIGLTKHQKDNKFKYG